MEKESTGIAVTRFGTKTEQRTMQSNLAIALSNRGVLFAIRGNLDRAKKDFHAAMKLKARDEVVANNLARMNYSPFDA
jgi:Flp pilus assembly protein TadD